MSSKFRFNRTVSSISTTHTQINELEKELKQREKKKKANLELEVVAANINEFDDTESTQRCTSLLDLFSDRAFFLSKIQQIQAEIKILNDKYQKQIEKLNLKEKQFYQLVL